MINRFIFVDYNRFKDEKYRLKFINDYKSDDNLTFNLIILSDNHDINFMDIYKFGFIGFIRNVIPKNSKSLVTYLIDNNLIFVREEGSFKLIPSFNVNLDKNVNYYGIRNFTIIFETDLQLPEWL